MSLKPWSYSIFLTLVLLVCSEGHGRDWKPYQTTRKGDIYYFDPESIEKLPGEVVKVWVKTEKTDFSGDNLREHVKSITSGNKEKVTGEVIQLYEINCPDRKYRIINLAVYDKNNEIKEYYNDPTEWQPIPPESVTQFLHKEVCK
jgi:hypothetical protein